MYCFVGIRVCKGGLQSRIPASLSQKFPISYCFHRLPEFQKKHTELKKKEKTKAIACLIHICQSRTHVWVVMISRIPGTHEEKLHFPCLNSGESHFLGSSQILFPMKIYVFCIFMNPAPYLFQFRISNIPSQALMFVLFIATSCQFHIGQNCDNPGGQAIINGNSQKMRYFTIIVGECH